MLTVAVAQPPALQSSYTKVSTPLNPVFGVYSIVPSVFTTAVPLSGVVTTVGVAPLGVSFASTSIVTGVLREVSTLSSAAIGATVDVGVAGTITTTEAVPYTLAFPFTDTL